MAKIGTAAANAYTGTFGESVQANMDAAGKAIQAGLLDPNANAKDTQQVIQQLSSVSELMGEEIPAVAKAAGQAIKTGLADNATEAMDLFAAANRNGLNISEDFLDTINEYGTQFRKLGLDGPEAVGLINQAVKGGARDADIAADAFKEFSIRVLDGSESSSEAFEELGFNAEDLGARFAQGGSVAREATGELLGEINKIEDPVKKNQIALALFGTQAEDLGGALNNFNLDTAVNSLGQVAGAAETAANVMGGNTASTIEGARRSIEVSMAGVQTSLAQAFGPSLEKVANWVKTHQPEITGFFIAVGDAAFVLGDILLLWASTSLSNFATFSRILGEQIEGLLQPLGLVTEVFGKLTGDKGIEDAGVAMQDFQDKLNGAADKADAAATAINDKARPALNSMRDAFNENATAAQDAQLLMRALGESVTAIPTAHGINLSDNSPEAKARLEALGITIKEIPGTKEVEMVALTDEGQRVLNNFYAQNTGKKIAIEAEVSLSARVNNGDLTVSKASPWATKQADGGILSFADGKLPDDALIQKGRGSGLVQWAEGETEEEAFIPLAKSKRARSVAIWREVGKRFGLLSMANGGITGGAGSLTDVQSGMWEALQQAFPDATITSATRTVDVGAGYDYHMQGKALDVVGPDMPGIAAWIAKNYPGSLELIHSNGFGSNIKNGQNVGDGYGYYGADTMAGHSDHVHWAMANRPNVTAGEPGSGGGTGGGASSGGSGGGSGGSGASTGGSLGSGGGSANTTGATEVFVVNMPGGSSSAITADAGTDAAANSPDPATATPTTETPSTAPSTTDQADHPLMGTPLTGELFNGDAPWYQATSPEQALTNLQTQASAQWTETSEGFQSFFQDNWREMLETGAGVLGMGAMGGGTTLNVTNNGMDPNSAAAAVERMVRRRTMATRSSGGFGR
ncbi:phage tail tape measure protein [Nocardia sp. IBHARD005]|uniref:phage tail tape measure protein n=1 Tax=Nocardia sp. IBHARD005 TaxID=3457765 RepID=UPI004057CC4F